MKIVRAGGDVKCVEGGCWAGSIENYYPPGNFRYPDIPLPKRYFWVDDLPNFPFGGIMLALLEGIYQWRFVDELISIPSFQNSSIVSYWKHSCQNINNIQRRLKKMQWSFGSVFEVKPSPPAAPPGRPRIVFFWQWWDALKKPPLKNCIISHPLIPRFGQIHLSQAAVDFWIRGNQLKVHSLLVWGPVVWIPGILWKGLDSLRVSLPRL